MSATTSTQICSSSNSSAKKCFNLECKDSSNSRKAWRLRSGDFALLCDRCATAYEEGRFCEMFHQGATGWRCCEACGKQVHCGCIVSIYAFAFLDAGGIECITCAKKNVLSTSSPGWAHPLLYQAPFPERSKDFFVKNLNQLAGSGPVPWRQAASLFNSAISQTEVHPRIKFEVERLVGCKRLAESPLEKGKIEDFSERLMNGGLKIGMQNTIDNGNSGNSGEEKLGSLINDSQQSSTLWEELSSAQFGMHMSYTSLNEANGSVGGSGTSLQLTTPAPVARAFHGNLTNGAELLVDTQFRNGRPRADGHGRSFLFPRYWARFTDEELQQISGYKNSVITPLFEKMLSASDAGRVGRLVLPKKCAEAYFPPITQSEGLPLKVQDCQGKDWTFQYRFWPNNNSRMYVLEGVTPCIQNMRLQAGDIVTFSRLEPEGKLVMGYRKATVTAQSDQVNETSKISNAVTTNGDAELAEPLPPWAWTNVDKSGYIANEALEGKSSKKRESSTLGLKSKRLRIENEDVIELKITWEEAQGLLRPPTDSVPSIVVIEGFEFEEYEEAPLVGKPTIFATDNKGHNFQWVQCEDCLKWRKLPVNTLLPYRWTCSSNTLDPERSLCSAVQELTAEQLEELVTSSNLVSSWKKMKAPKTYVGSLEALEGLDTLANLSVLGNGEGPQASSQATTKHPRHRPGCSCIVCIQPPSGKGPKHKESCTCNVCSTVKRRFKTLMMKREKKQSEKEADIMRKKQQQPSTEKLPDDEPSHSCKTGSSSPDEKKVVGSEGSYDDPTRIKTSTSPFKGQIDLNIQPEREEELSPASDSGSLTRMLQHPESLKARQQKLSIPDGESDSAGIQLSPSGATSEKVANSIVLGSSHQYLDEGNPSALPIEVSASSPAR